MAGSEWHGECSYLHKKMELLKSQVTDVDAIEEFDFSDIDALFESKGRGTHLLEHEFEPFTKDPEQYTNENGEIKMKWKWVHKLTLKQFYRHQSNSGKSFDSGTLLTIVYHMGPHMVKFCRDGF